MEWESTNEFTFFVVWFQRTKSASWILLIQWKITQLAFYFRIIFFRTASVSVWVSDNLNVREMWNGQWVRHMAVAVFVRDLITSIMWFILFYGNLVKELRPKIHNFFALTRLKLIFACCSWRLNSLAHSVYDCTLDVRGKVVDEKFFFPFQYFRDTANRSDAVRCEPNVLLRVQPEISHKIHNQMDSD